MKCIKSLFIDNWDRLSFEQCYVLRSLKDYADRLEVDYDNIYDSYKTNEDFMLYCVLSKDSFSSKSWRKEKEERKKDIEILIKDWNLNNFDDLFRVSRIVEEKIPQESWSVSFNIHQLFTLLANYPTYIDIVKLYLAHGAPYGFDLRYNVISSLIDMIGVEHTKKLINSYEFVSKSNWLCTFWETLPKKSLTSEHAQEFIEFLIDEKEQKATFVVPDAINLTKYLVVDKGIVMKVSEIIIEMNESNPNVTSKFLNRMHKDEDIDALLNLFINNLDMLKKLYILAMPNHFDYEGKLLEKIVEKDLPFWNEYTNQIAQRKFDGSYFEEVLQRVWLSDNYNSMIETAFDNIFLDPLNFIGDSKMKLVFPNNIKSDQQIRLRQKEWIKNYIRDNYLYSESMKKIFDVINTVYENEKIDFYLEYLKCSKDVNSFRNIPLFPSSYSWSGSEVPLFDKKIRFLDELIDSLTGIDFIDHKVYLRGIKNRLEESRRETQLREYLEENDFA